MTCVTGSAARAPRPRCGSARLARRDRCDARDRYLVPGPAAAIDPAVLVVSLACVRGIDAGVSRSATIRAQAAKHIINRFFPLSVLRCRPGPDGLLRRPGGDHVADEDVPGGIRRQRPADSSGSRSPHMRRLPRCPATCRRISSRCSEPRATRQGRRAGGAGVPGLSAGPSRQSGQCRPGIGELRTYREKNTPTAEPISAGALADAEGPVHRLRPGPGSGRPGWVRACLFPARGEIEVSVIPGTGHNRICTRPQTRCSAWPMTGWPASSPAVPGPIRLPVGDCTRVNRKTGLAGPR
jgi:hypothetical protein